MVDKTVLFLQLFLVVSWVKKHRKTSGALTILMSTARNSRLAVEPKGGANKVGEKFEKEECGWSSLFQYVHRGTRFFEVINQWPVERPTDWVDLRNAEKALPAKVRKSIEDNRNVLP